jgi:hypothetical protein
MIPLNVTFADGQRANLEARPFAVELWERETKQKLSALSDGVGAGDLLRMAYYELKLSGEQVGKYDEWAATVKDIIEDDDPKEDAGPASPA